MGHEGKEVQFEQYSDYQELQKPCEQLLFTLGTRNAIEVFIMGAI